MEDSGARETGGQQDVRSELSDLEDALLKSKARQRKLRWWSQGVTLAVIAVLAIYLVIFYRTFKTNLSAAKFSESIQTHMAEIAPVVTKSSVDVVTEVSPVYMELAEKKLETLMPQFKSEANKRVEILLANMSKFAEDELQTRLDKLVKGQAEEFRKAYPDLTDEQIEKFIKETDEDLQTAFVEASEDILNQSLPEITEMKYLAESLSEEHKDLETHELLRLFLHKLLILLDKEIMEGEMP
jgi:hypothetical protein